jgi:hypothetical protein
MCTVDASAANLYTMYRKATPADKGRLYEQIVTNLIKSYRLNPNWPIVKVLCSKYPEFARAADHNGDTFLHYGVKHAVPSLAQELLTVYHCDVNACNLQGQTPLQLVTEALHDTQNGAFLVTRELFLEIQDFLLRHGAYRQSGSKLVRNQQQQPIIDGVLDDAPLLAIIDPRRMQVQSEPIVMQRVQPNIMPIPQPMPQPDGAESRIEHVHKIGGRSYTLLAGLSLAALACYGFYRYWYSDIEKEDAQKADADDGVQPQESDL